MRHSEFNPSADTTNRFFQIWILPEKNGIEPGYEQNEIPEGARNGQLCLIGFRDGRGDSVTIHQDVELYASILSVGDKVTHEVAEGRSIWVQLASGSIEVNGTAMSAGDGVALTDETIVEITASEESEFLLFG